MSAVPERRRWPDLAAGVAVVGACGVCCAGPLLAVLGGVGVVAAAAAFVVPALAAIAVIAVAAAVWLLHRHPAHAAEHAPGVVDLGRPTTPPGNSSMPGSVTAAMTSAKPMSRP